MFTAALLELIFKIWQAGFGSGNRSYTFKPPSLPAHSPVPSQNSWKLWLLYHLVKTKLKCFHGNYRLVLFMPANSFVLTCRWFGQCDDFYGLHGNLQTIDFYVRPTLATKTESNSLTCWSPCPLDGKLKVAYLLIFPSRFLNWPSWWNKNTSKPGSLW